MKKNWLPFLLLSSLAFTACKKEDQDFTPYLKGKRDGTLFNCTTYLNARYVNGGLIMSGTFDNGSVLLVIEPFNNSAGERTTNENNQVEIYYSGTMYYAGSISPGTTAQGSGRINILEVSNTYVKGTFECDAPIEPGAGINTSLRITEGEFKLKRLL